MPFTLAHPAAAWPLWLASGRRLRLAALVIGSTTPDYEYFVRMQAIGIGGHTPLGLMLFCLPAGWFALWLFDHLARQGIDMALPHGWTLPGPPAVRYSPYSTAIALLLGAASHVVWDAFTHRTGAVVKLLPVLAEPMASGALNIPWYKLLQHGSTLVGGAVLGFIALKWAARQPRATPMQLIGRALALVGAPVAVAMLNGFRFVPDGLQRSVVAAGVALTFALGVELVLLGVYTACSSQSAKRPHQGR